MLNIAVINIKDVGKYLVKIIIVFAIVIIIARYFHFGQKDSKKESIDINFKFNIDQLGSGISTYCLETTLPKITENTEYGIKEDSLNIIQRVLNIELAMAKNIVESTDYEINVQELTIDDKEELIADNLQTQVIPDNNIQAKYTNQYGTVEIRNETEYELTEDLLKPDIEIVNKKDIIIFHTHTCESYTPTENFGYEASGNFRTTDLNYSVARVGTEFQKFLGSYGFNATHDTTYHDFPAYSGSYNRSLVTVENILAKTNAQMVFDIHRDALGNNDAYSPKVKIGDEYAAQITFVMGTDAGGLEHPNWRNNLKFAIKVQEKANELYPGLFRPIILRTSRYNQHVADFANIIEVGATGNTMEECINSMKYLAKILNEI